MAFTMRDSAAPITDLDIKRLERKIKLNLPEAYKAFLMKHNGGRPTPKFFPIEGLPKNPVGQVLDFFR